MVVRLPLLILGLASVLAAQVPLFPLKEVRPGLQGTGRTVFSGSKIEEFQVEVLGVLENAGPKQSIILGRLSGGPMERTGVMQGMSGSPVFIDGRLVGAVALAFPLSTEPIAGIRPIEEMLRDRTPPGTPSARVGVPFLERDLARLFPPRQEVLTDPSRLVEIATPVSFSGFTRRTIEEFAPQLRSLGLEPRQGMTGGGSSSDVMGDASSVRPGSMISVLLLRGDMSLGADGTVTHVQGDRVYAFGHRFLSVGATELPFARSEVITIAPNLATSFKISAAKELMGSITSDYSTAVSGLLGRRAPMVPLSITVTSPGSAAEPAHHSKYRMEIVNDRYLTPFLLQMATYSAIDATERTLGSSTVVLRGRIEFTNGATPVRLDDTYSGDGNIPVQASLGVAAPLAYLLQAGFESLALKAITMEIEVLGRKRQWVVDQVWPVRKTVRPGEDLDLMIALVGENGEEKVMTASYPVPQGAPNGTIHVTVADAMTVNLLEYQYLVGRRQRSPVQLVALLNELRTNSGVYVRLWRSERSYRIQGQTLPSPPASIKLMLGRGEAAGASPSPISKVTEIRLDVGEAVVTGSKTIQVEVKE